MQFLEPIIAIVSLFKRFKFPSKYKDLGGLGIALNFCGYMLSLILICFIKITPLSILLGPIFSI